jgi:hypothetical protein
LKIFPICNFFKEGAGKSISLMKERPFIQATRLIGQKCRLKGRLIDFGVLIVSRCQVEALISEVGEFVAV